MGPTASRGARLREFCDAVYGRLHTLQERCRALRSAAECRGMLRNAAECHGVLRSAAECCGMLRNAVERPVPYGPSLAFSPKKKIKKWKQADSIITLWWQACLIV